jgi:HEAT repeat protein
MRRSTLGLVLGAAGVLAFGIWLGGQRASADHSADHASGRAADQASGRAADHASGRAADLASARAAARSPQLATKPLAPGLAEDLRDRDPLVRRNAIAELAASGTADPRILVEASRDADLNVAVAATEGLGALYRDGRISAAELLARADRNAPAKVRVAAINGLGTLATEDSAKALIALLANGSEIERRSAAIVLVHQDPALAVPALIAALRDSDENVRMNARESLRTFARGRDLGDDPQAWSQWWQRR